LWTNCAKPKKEKYLYLFFLYSAKALPIKDFALFYLKLNAVLAFRSSSFLFFFSPNYIFLEKTNKIGGYSYFKKIFFIKKLFVGFKNPLYLLQLKSFKKLYYEQSRINRKNR